MSELLTRRRLLLAMQKTGLDTSPRIAEYGYYCSRSKTGISADANWCYTDWYYVTQSARQRVYDNCTNSNHTYQYDTSETDGDYWYGPERTVTIYSKIRFSIKISEIDNVYAYSGLTGQIFFAGKNTQYYGYTNINDMPT